MLVKIKLNLIVVWMKNWEYKCFSAKTGQCVDHFHPRICKGLFSCKEPESSFLDLQSCKTFDLTDSGQRCTFQTGQKLLSFSFILFEKCVLQGKANNFNLLLVISVRSPNSISDPRAACQRLNCYEVFPPARAFLCGMPRASKFRLLLLLLTFSFLFILLFLPQLLFRPESLFVCINFYVCSCPVRSE